MISPITRAQPRDISHKPVYKSHFAGISRNQDILPGFRNINLFSALSTGAPGLECPEPRIAFSSGVSWRYFHAAEPRPPSAGAPSSIPEHGAIFVRLRLFLSAIQSAGCQTEPTGPLFTSPDNHHKPAGVPTLLLPHPPVNACSSGSPSESPVPSPLRPQLHLSLPSPPQFVQQIKR